MSWEEKGLGRRGYVWPARCLMAGIRSAGEWLCWPCRVHEEALWASGVLQKDIRPPRWELAASADGRRQLEGGSLTAQCVLCPIRHGAFRQTVDTHEWVHQVTFYAQAEAGSITLSSLLLPSGSRGCTVAVTLVSAKEGVALLEERLRIPLNALVCALSTPDMGL